MKIRYKSYLFISLSFVGNAICMEQEQQIIKYEKRMPDHVRAMLDRNKKHKGQCSRSCGWCGGGPGLDREEKWYALICATYYEDSSAVNNLLEDGALDKNALKFTEYDALGGLPRFVDTFPRLHVLPLTVARYTGNQEIITTLEQKSTLEDKEMVPLCALAVYMGDEGLLNQCIAHNDFDPLYDDKLGGSLLKLAVRNGHKDMVKRLLGLPDIKQYINSNRFGGAPVLFIAAQHGFYDVAQQLCQAGANPDISYLHPQSHAKILPIHIAAEQKHQNIVTLLCEKSEGYDNGRYWTYGQLALHKALFTNDERTIKVLLSVPAVNNYFYNDYFKTIQDIAIKYGYLRKDKI